MKKSLIHHLLGRVQADGLAVRYWDGEEIIYGPGPVKVKMEFTAEPPPGFSLEDPIMAFGEAYMDGILEFSGSMTDLLQIMDENTEKIYSGRIMQAIRRRIMKSAAKAQQKSNVQHHYDLGNDFFALWLDQSMNYSCGYFQHPDDLLDQVQQQKISHVLRKLCLKPGDRLLDIGSGWGCLIIRAALEYGVKATGITLSEEQYVSTKEQIAKLGLVDQVDVRLLNYLDLDEKQDQFDKIVSIGMFEHVGQANHPRYMEKVNRLLTPGGLSLLHTIACLKEAIPNTWTAKYIFPGGYIPSLREVVNLLPDFNFHLIHLESLRMHYALTLDRWHENFCKHRAEIEAKYGQRFARMWNLYLMTSAASFRNGLEIYQLLFTKGLNNELPLTYGHLYDS